MRIKKMQQRLAQVGEIRFGDSVAVPGKNYRRPVKLEKFKLTTQDRELAEAVAQAYGGKPEWWQPQNGGLPKWAVQTTVDSLPVVVPPLDMVEPGTSYELWDRGQPKRRCDGETEVISGRACVCGDSRNTGDSFCKTKMRVVFMLADVVSAGTWLLTSGGWYAATELPTTYDLLQAQGGYQRARLSLQQRKAHKPGEAKPRLWSTPVLHIPTASAAELTGVAPALPAAPTAPAIEAAPAPAEPEVIEAEFETLPEPEAAPSAPAPAPKTSTPASSTAIDEKRAVWTACMEAANARGWTKTTQVMEEYRKALGKSPSESTVEDFQKFLAHLNGAAS